MIDTDITDHTGINLVGGYSFNDFLVVEGRMLMSPSIEYYENVKVEIDSAYGLYLTAGFPLDNNLSIYGLIGHTELEASASYQSYSASVDESSTSYGAGLRYSILEAYTAKVEITELADDVRAISLGLRVNF